MTDEYIRKKDVVDTVPKERIVEYMDEFGAGYNSCRNDILRSIESITPADVAPVVRCKDCKHFNHLYRFNRNVCGCAQGCVRPEPDGYCSYGERRKT